MSLRCVQQVLREGKATLSICCEIVEYQSFRNLLSYGVHQILSLNYSRTNDIQQMYVLYFFGTIINQFLLCLTPAIEVMSQDFQEIDLHIFGKKSVVSLLGNTIIGWIGAYTAYIVLIADSEYVENDRVLNSNDDLVIECQENSMQFFVFALTVGLSLFCFYLSHPVKNKIYRNTPLVISMIVNVVYTVVILIYPSSTIGSMKVLNLNTNLKIGVILIVAVVSILMNLFEHFIIKRLLQKSYAKKLRERTADQVKRILR